jgi:hypothetical protein
MRVVLWNENDKKDAYHTAKKKERFQIMWVNGMHGPEFVVEPKLFFEALGTMEEIGVKAGLPLTGVLLPLS